MSNKNNVQIRRACSLVSTVPGLRKDETIFLLEIEENLKTGITNADKMINFFKKQNFLDKKKLYNFLSYRQN